MSSTSLVWNSWGFKLHSTGWSGFGNLPIWPNSQSPQPYKDFPAIAKAWLDPQTIFLISLLLSSFLSISTGLVTGSAILPELFYIIVIFFIIKK